MRTNGKIGLRGEYKPKYTVQGERLSPFGHYGEISLGGGFYALLSMRAYRTEDVDALRDDVKRMNTPKTKRKGANDEPDASRNEATNDN